MIEAGLATALERVEREREDPEAWLALAHRGARLGGTPPLPIGPGDRDALGFALALDPGSDALAAWLLTALGLVPDGPDRDGALPRRVTRSRDGAPMALVPGGPCRWGHGAGGPDHWPEAATTLAPFYLDVWPVSMGAWRRHGAGLAGWGQEAAADDQPAFGVSHVLALAYAAAVGAHLPSEAQWETAARGTDGRPFPWGDAPPDPTRVARFPSAEHSGYEHARRELGLGPAAFVARLGTRVGDAGPYGHRELVGNVLQWCRDPWSEDAGAAWRRVADPVCPHPSVRRVIKGGSWKEDEDACFRAWRRQGWHQDHGANGEAGLRLAVELAWLS